MNKLVVSAFILCFFSCSSEYGNFENPKIDRSNFSLELVPSDSTIYRLDSTATPLISALNYNSDLGILSFFYGNRLYMYNDTSQYAFRKVKLKYQVNNYSLLDSNNIVVLSYASKKIRKINLSGLSSSKSYKINTKLIRFYPLSVAKINPIIVEGDKIIYLGNISGEYITENKDNRKVIGVINTDTKTTSFFGSYPDIYRKYNWGGGLFRWVYADYNKSEGTIIVSFPASHNLYVYPISDLNKSTSYYAGSKFVESTKYLDKPKSFHTGSDDKAKHFAETPSYARVLYDKYRKVYYRIVEHPTKFDDVPGWNKPLSVIVLNDKFELVGETFLGETHDNNRFAIYVGRNGLNVPVASKSEDYIKYKTYKLCKLRR